jgi:hypothetical protein
LIRSIESFEDIIVSSNIDSSFSINQELKVLPKLFEYRLPILKIMKSILYHSTEFSNFLVGQQQQLTTDSNQEDVDFNENSKQTVSSSKNDQKAIHSTGNDQQVGLDVNHSVKKGSKKKNEYTTQTNALNLISMKNNIYGDSTYKKILQPTEENQRVTRTNTSGEDAARNKAADKRLAAERLAAEKLAADKQKRKKSAALARKRKADINTKEQTPSSEANTEVLALQAQIKALQQSLKSSNIPIQAEVVVATQKPLAKRNSNKKNKVTENNGESKGEDSLILDEEVSLNQKILIILYLYS